MKDKFLLNQDMFKQGELEEYSGFSLDLTPGLVDRLIREGNDIVNAYYMKDDSNDIYFYLEGYLHNQCMRNHLLPDGNKRMHLRLTIFYTSLISNKDLK